MGRRRIALTIVGLLGFLAVATDSRAQRPPQQQPPPVPVPASNVSSVVRGGVVIISYDIASGDQNAQFAVSLEVSSDGGKTYAIRPRTLKGDVGPSVRAGIGKQMTWEAARDVETLEVDRYRYRVMATPVRAAAQATPATSQSPAKVQSVPAAANPATPPGVTAPAPKGSGRKWAGIGLLAGGGALAVMSMTMLNTEHCDEFGCEKKPNQALLWGGLGAAGGGIALLAIGGSNSSEGTQVVLRGRGVVVQHHMPVEKLFRLRGVSPGR